MLIAMCATPPTLMRLLSCATVSSPNTIYRLKPLTSSVLVRSTFSTANFFREVRLGETLTITYQLAGLSEQGIRWRVRHDFLKANGKKAVTVLLEGTILNLTTRQPTIPTPEIMAVFQQVPRSSDFEQLSDSRWFTVKPTSENL